MQNEDPVSTTAPILADLDIEGGAPQDGFCPRTILVVDDDPIILMNTAALLEDIGHHVVEAGSGEEALSSFTRRPEIDLLITDHAMPGMTGSELIDAARSLRPELAVILATGFAAEAVTQARGLTRLNKPYSFSELEAAVARADA